MKNNAEMAAQHGMWIIFDLYNNVHGVGTTEERVAGMRWLWKMPEKQFLELWRDMAHVFKRYPNVLLELGNEPNGDPRHRDIWLERSIKAIEILREEGFKNYIIIPLPNVATRARDSRYRCPR
jgi:aryl-phospho-beta-D-glucosidase BglC (GH1 family)